MEIVKNGELLETQILEDAGAKAHRLLEAADRECDAIREAGEKRLQEDLARAGAALQTRLETLRRELAASLPLDFRRTRLAFLQESLDKALSGYLAGLSTEAVGRVVGGQLARSAAAFADKRIVLRHAGLDGAQARKIVAASLPGAVVESVAELTGEEAEIAGRGLIVECADGSRRCRATLGELSLHLLEEHREELITALYGKDANK